MGVGLASERIWLFRDILGYFAPAGRHGERIGVALALAFHAGSGAERRA